MNQNQHIQRKGLFLPGIKSWIYLVITFSISLMSCARYYYAPNSNNIPLLSEKEAKINAQYSSGTISKGFECQSAFAVTRHFGGMINTMVGGGKEDGFESGSGETKTSFIEIGPGYFTSLGSTSLIFETYGGIGTGRVKNIYYGNGSSKVRNTRYFIQPSIGVKVKGFEFGISSRWSLLRQKVVSNTSSGSSPISILEDISERPESILWEPSLVLRAGGEKFLVQIQYTLSENLSNPDRIFAQEIGYVSIGFSIPIKYKSIGQ